MKKTVIRSLALLLACLMILAVTPLPVFANQSRYYNFRKNYTLTGDPKTDIVNIAKAQVGATKSELGYTEGWCDNFVSDCAILAKCAAAIPQGGDVYDFKKNLVNAGAVSVSSPEAGDVIIYRCTVCNGYKHAALAISSTRSIHGNLYSNGVSSCMEINTSGYGDDYSHHVGSGIVMEYYRPKYHTHKYENYVCSCGAFDPTSVRETALSPKPTNYYINTDSFEIHTGPYGACPTVSTSYKKNSILPVIAEVTNGYGNTWYKIADGQYIYTDRISKGITISASIGKTSMTKGDSNSLSGTIYNAKLSAITASLDGKTYAAITEILHDNLNIGSSKIATDIDFSSLAVGSHTIEIIAYKAANTAVVYKKSITFTVNPKTNYVNVSTGQFYFKNQSTGKYLTVDGNADNNKQNVSVAALSNATGQIMNIVKVSDLTYKFRPQCSSSRLINPFADSVTSGVNVNIYNDMGNDSTQWWMFDQVSSNTYAIRNKQNPNVCLTVSGTNVNVTTYSGAGTQLWSLESVGHTTHTWNAGVVTTQPTCKSEGVKTYTCTVCGATRTESIAKLTTHSWNAGTVTTQPTCTANGQKTYTCTVCGTTRTESVSSLGHAYGAWTRSNDIQHQRVCSRNSSHVEYADHIWNEGVITRTPSCTQTGISTVTCTVCGAAVENVIPKNDHKDDNGDLFCDICGTQMASYSLAVKEVSGNTVSVALTAKHSIGLIAGDISITFDNSVLQYQNGVPGKDASQALLTSNPISFTFDSQASAVQYAFYFREELFDRETFNSLAYTPGAVDINAEDFELAVLTFKIIDPSAASAELTGAVNTTNSRNNILGKPGCAGCTVPLTCTAHVWDNGVVTKTPTCTEDGVRTFTCKNCGETKTVTITSPGHAYGEWTKLNETQHQRVCANDASHVETENHTWNSGVTVNGSTVYTCTVCGAKKEILPPAEPDLIVAATSVTAQPGETVTVDLNITKIVPASYLRLSLSYDKTALTLVKAESTGLFDQFDSDYNISFSNKENVTVTGKIAYLTFTVSGDAAPGEYEIKLIARECYNDDEQIITARADAGMITVRDFVIGDVTGDGLIDGRDIIRLRKYLSEKDDDAGTSPVTISAGADCTGDGSVDGRDLIRLRKYLASYDEDTGTSTVKLG